MSTPDSETPSGKKSPHSPSRARQDACPRPAARAVRSILEQPHSDGALVSPHPAVPGSCASPSRVLVRDGICRAPGVLAGNCVSTRVWSVTNNIDLSDIGASIRAPFPVGLITGSRLVPDRQPGSQGIIPIWQPPRKSPHPGNRDPTSRPAPFLSHRCCLPARYGSRQTPESRNRVQSGSACRTAR